MPGMPSPHGVWARAAASAAGSKWVLPDATTAALASTSSFHFRSASLLALMRSARVVGFGAGTGAAGVPACAALILSRKLPICFSFLAPEGRSLVIALKIPASAGLLMIAQRAAKGQPP